MATIATTEPTELRAGDTWAWRREDLTGDYPASAGWALKYYFRNASGFFDVAADADGDAFAVAVAKAVTATRVAGSYDWIAVVESASDRHQVDSGILAVRPDFSAAAALDARSFARTLFDAVEAALISKASAGQLDLVKASLSDRGVEYSQGALMSLRSQLLSEVRRETSAQNGVDSRRVLVRFG
jgi:hypothetical protein